MQFGKTETRKWIMSVINAMPDPDLKHQRAEGEDTIQGFYIMAADGTSYGWLNDNDANEVSSFMDRALPQFQNRHAQNIQISDALMKEKWSQTPPPGTAVVRVFSRIRPLPQGAHDSNNAVGRDHLWIYPSEIDAMIEGAEQGGAVELPQTLVARMVRFHLLDNVRGEPDMWKGDEIRQADFTAGARQIGSNRLAVSFAGTFNQETQNKKRGFQGHIKGELEIDKASKQVVRFRAYGEGKAWGVSRFTPNAPRGQFPLVIAMIETNDAISKVVPPEAIYYDYERPWLHVTANP